MPVKIIAEIGSNFDGSLDKAVEYVRTAHKIGADCVKFQTLKKDKLVAKQIYQHDKWVSNPIYDNFANIELPDRWHFEIKKCVDRLGIEFISTPFYLEAVELLEKVGVSTYKIASGDITFYPLLKEVAKTGKSVILSTGASSLDDVKKALGVLTSNGAGDIALLHCSSIYPPRWEEMNLRAITTMKETFNLPVGMSDHSPGTLVPIASVALGATIIEKHLTLDRNSDGPDHPFAATCDEFESMVRYIRNLEKVLGDGRKLPSKRELEKQSCMRRGVYDPQTCRPVSDEHGVWLRPQIKKESV